MKYSAHGKVRGEEVLREILGDATRENGPTDMGTFGMFVSIGVSCPHHYMSGKFGHQTTLGI